MVRGKIFLIPFPFDDLSASKVRPVIALTEPIGIHRHVIVSFISSRVPDEGAQSDIILRKDEPELSATGLKKDSIVLWHRLLTIHEGLLQRELGVLPSAILENIQNRIIKLFKGEI